MRPWSQLSRDEQIEVRKQMVLRGGQSVNGVAGWYAAQRTRGTPVIGRKNQCYPTMASRSLTKPQNPSASTR